MSTTLARRTTMRSSKPLRKSKATAKDRALYRAKQVERLERDGYRCVFCGKPGRLDVAHVVSLGMGGNRYDSESPLNRIYNLRSLHGGLSPEQCHARQTVGEWRWSDIGVHAECANGHRYEPEKLHDLTCVQCGRNLVVVGPPR